MNGERTERRESNFSFRKVMSIISQFVIDIFRIRNPEEKKQKRKLNKEIEELEKEKIK